MPEGSCECEWLPAGESCYEPIHIEVNGRKYCVLHYPALSKAEDFWKALQHRLDEQNKYYLNFVGVWFPRALFFVDQTFASAVDFSNARFSSYVHFGRAEFEDVNFSGAQFTGHANFDGATFLGTAKFFNADFRGDAFFRLVTFVGNSDFTQSTFSGRADFVGVEVKADVNFYLAKFDKMADFSAARLPVSDPSVRSTVQWRRSRFHNASFIETEFTQCNFKMACFAKVQFNRAVISHGVNFSVTDFKESNFTGSLLTGSNFDGAFFLKTPNFNKTVFSGTTVFSTARFPSADFSEAVFSGNADFSSAKFETSLSKYELERLRACCEIGDDATNQSELVRVSFDRTTFKDGLLVKTTDFFQDRYLLTFDDAVFERPERVKFQSVSMPPHSFMNVDPRKFHFADVRWGFIDRRTALREARAALGKHQRLYSGPMLELAYRQLAVNAEENNRYEEAANLRYLAMEVARSMRWRRVDWLRLSWWYWLLSGYGERVRRAFAALIIIWLTFAVVYWSWSDATWWQAKQQNQNATEKSELVAPRLTFVEALLYSGGVMALQKPEPLPANKRAKLFVLLETILGPVQGALLALAIRRKFMR